MNFQKSFRENSRLFFLCLRVSLSVIWSITSETPGKAQPQGKSFFRHSFMPCGNVPKRRDRCLGKIISEKAARIFGMLSCVKAPISQAIAKMIFLSVLLLLQRCQRLSSLGVKPSVFTETHLLGKISSFFVMHLSVGSLMTINSTDREESGMTVRSY